MKVYIIHKDNSYKEMIIGKVFTNKDKAEAWLKILRIENAFAVLVEREVTNG